MFKHFHCDVHLLLLCKVIAKLNHQVYGECKLHKCFQSLKLLGEKFLLHKNVAILEPIDAEDFSKIKI